MYSFRLNTNFSVKEDKDDFSKMPSATALKKVEFIDIVKSTDGYNKKKYREIKRSSVELSLRKPRNTFIIFRSLVKNLILKEFPNGTFADISKITAMMWSKKGPKLENYVKYLAEQDKLCQDCSEIIHVKLKCKEPKKRRTILDYSFEETVNQPKKRQKFIEYKTKKSKKPKYIYKGNDFSRVEDVFIQQ